MNSKSVARNYASAQAQTLESVPPSFVPHTWAWSWCRRVACDGPQTLHLNPPTAVQGLHDVWVMELVISMAWRKWVCLIFFITYEVILHNGKHFRQNI